MPEAEPNPRGRSWRVVRRLFRWLRIAVVFSALGAVLLTVWLNHFGFPDILKEQIVAALRERGLDLQFTRMRLLWSRGIVADMPSREPTAIVREA